MHLQLLQGAGPVVEVEVRGDVHALGQGPQERFASGCASGDAHPVPPPAHSHRRGVALRQLLLRRLPLSRPTHRGVIYPALRRCCAVNEKPWPSIGAATSFAAMRELITDDYRTLAVEEWGDPTGIPVVYLHGTPMSRLARYPNDSLFHELGVRLITYDRPGFGGSTRNPGRRVIDAAADVAAITAALGLHRLAVFGVSGGGPHAMAFAARYPERVTRLGALASPAPRDAAGLDWTAGMSEETAAAPLWRWPEGRPSRNTWQISERPVSRRCRRSNRRSFRGRRSAR